MPDGAAGLARRAWGYPLRMDDTTHDTTPADERDAVVPPPGPSISEVDAEVRAKLTGQPVAAIAEQAEQAFATIGVQITGEQLADYADAVSSGSAFALEPVPEG
jgi:hypothetical protein